MTEELLPIAETHEVFNQVEPLQGFNAFQADRVLRDWVCWGGADWAVPQLDNYGRQVGGALRLAGIEANHHLPAFRSHDACGRRIDQVDFHPAYHQLMTAAIAAGHHCSPWQQPGPGAHVARAALAFMHTQADPGTGCPLTMTFAAVPVIASQPHLAELWLTKLLSRDYDPANRPWFDRRGVTLGMAMTEKQGGSDVRANTTTARPLGQGDRQLYRLVGHKWFCSAPMCDGFLVLAQAPSGLTCFLVPRWQDDGQRNALHVVRLKDKLGNRANASSEVELRGAIGYRLGDEGRGVRTIIDMVALTRFDCMLGSAALMRQGVSEALYHCDRRQAFGAPLSHQPLMQNVLADLGLEAEAALAMAMRTAKAMDATDNADEQLLLRVLQPIGKYWICKRALGHSGEAMECLGGNGYVEQSLLPRIYREAPVNAIWEGSGNIQCLDLLRALAREPGCLAVLRDELASARGQLKGYDQALAAWLDQLTSEPQPIQARRLVERLALLLQCALLLQHAPAPVAETFVASRLGEAGLLYGTLPDGLAPEPLLDRYRLQLTL